MQKTVSKKTSSNKKIVSPVDIPARENLDIRPGDTLRVTIKITEGGKTRMQVFEGLVLSVKHGREAGSMITVRKVASGVGVEKIFPLYSPMVEKFEVVRRAKMRRAKLYYIREKAAREIRRQMRNARAIPTTESTGISSEEAEMPVADAKEIEATVPASEQA